MKILLTGSTGFVGFHLQHRLAGSYVRCVSRYEAPDTIRIPVLNNRTDWAPALDGITCVIHCAARVHILNDQALDPLKHLEK